MDRTEQSMFECLEYCKIATLPEPHDKKSVWLTAICRTRKNDLGTYYAYCERGVDGKPNIVRDFGPCRAIVEIEEYFPLLYLDGSYVIKFKRDEQGTKKLIEYLKDNGVVLDWDNVDRKDLDKENIKIAIQKQLSDEKKKSKLIIKD